MNKPGHWAGREIKYKKNTKNYEEGSNQLDAGVEQASL